MRGGGTLQLAQPGRASATWTCCDSGCGRRAPRRWTSTCRVASWCVGRLRRQRVGRMSGRAGRGVQWHCSAVGLPAAACDERRLRVFDMNLATATSTQIGGNADGGGGRCAAAGLEPAAPVRRAARGGPGRPQPDCPHGAPIAVVRSTTPPPTSRIPRPQRRRPTVARSAACWSGVGHRLPRLTDGASACCVEPLAIAVFASSASPRLPGGVRIDDEEDVTDDARLGPARPLRRCVRRIRRRASRHVPLCPGQRSTRTGRPYLSHCCCPLTPRPAFHYAPRGWNGRGRFQARAPAWAP